MIEPIHEQAGIEEPKRLGVQSRLSMGAMMHRVEDMSRHIIQDLSRQLSSGITEAATLEMYHDFATKDQVYTMEVVVMSPHDYYKICKLIGELNERNTKAV